jgi:hypothetical protein
MIKRSKTCRETEKNKTEKMSGAASFEKCGYALWPEP